MLNKKKKVEENFPNFIIDGVQKSGTTTLHKYINQHPEIFMPTGKHQETNYFDTGENYSKGIKYYKECFKGHNND